MIPSPSEIQHAEHLWSCTVPFADSPSEAYLKSMIAPGLNVASEELAHIPDWKAGTGALAATVRGFDGALHGVHVIPLLPGEPRLTVGSSRGLMMLSSPSDAMVVAVGVEEAILAGVMTQLPALAVVDASELARLRVPKVVERLVIAHPAGTAAIAASELGERMWGERVVVTYLPPPRGYRNLMEAVEAARAEPKIRKGAL